MLQTLNKSWLENPPAGAVSLPDLRNAPPHSEEVKTGGKRILIIQGDWEGGMSRLALDLMDAGHHVAKVAFCAPDYLYSLRGIPTIGFRKPIRAFEKWLSNLIITEGYDTLFLYNHYRPYNQIAWELAKTLDIDCQVFELGLIRPNCVTVFSRHDFPVQRLTAEWAKVIAGEIEPGTHPLPEQLCQVSTLVKMSFFIGSYLFSRVTTPFFANFVDQREMKLAHHARHGAIHFFRFLERADHQRFDPLFAGPLSKKYYAVPLQVHSDTQILRCSDFDNIEQFICQVAFSFARHAPEDTVLIFKDHPMDRGYKDYTDLIEGLNKQIGGNRLHYVDRVHLPTMLSHALGVVNINSSVGLSGLIHQVPVIALGTAIYHQPELSFQGTLDEFWTEATPPAKERVKQFINLLLDLNQGRGTLSQRCFDVPGRCRIQWPPPFQDKFFV